MVTAENNQKQKTDMKKFFTNYGLPTLVAIVIFVIISCIYMSPALDGKIIGGGDGIQGRSVQNEAVSFRDATGEPCWWTDAQFGGMPTYQIGGGRYTSDSWMQPFRYVLLSGLRSPICIVLIYLLSFFALFRSMKVDKWVSIAGAIAVAFSSYFFVIIGANHHGKTVSLALMSVVLAGLYLIFNGHRKTGAVYTLLGTSVGFFLHPQMSYYVCFIIGAFWVAELWQTFSLKNWKTFGLSTLIFGACFGIGLGTGTATTFANLEYAEETMRGGQSDYIDPKKPQQTVSDGLSFEYATGYSYQPEECWTFLIPNYMGGSSAYDLGKDSNFAKDLKKTGVHASQAASFAQHAPTYWGEEGTSGPVYMGAIVCFLFLLGLIIVRGPYKWLLLVATLLSVILSLGRHFSGPTQFFLDYVPMYNKFRAVESILVIAEITMPLLGFLALKRITDAKASAEGARKLGIPVLISGGITLLLLLIAVLSSPSFAGLNDAAYDQMLPGLSGMLATAREEMFMSDVWRSVLFVILGAALVFAYVRMDKFKSNLLFGGLLSVLILADMWGVDKRYMNEKHFESGNFYEKAFREQSYEKQILQDKDPHFRVFNLTDSQGPFNDARTSYRLKSIGGYSAAKLRRYQDLIEQHIGKFHMPVINMLNTKYLVQWDAQQQEKLVHLNPEAFGPAWFVNQLTAAQTPNEECDALNEIDLRHNAVYDVKFQLEAQQGGCLAAAAVDSSAWVKLTKYTPIALDYECQNAQPGTVVFSEIYYPHGWQAYVDDQPVEHYRVNYVLRALNLEAGHHKIRFEFHPDSIDKGNTLSMIFVILLYLIVFGCIGKGVWDLKKSNQH